MLYKKDEILEEDDKIEISLDGVEKNITEKNLKIKGFEGKYKIENKRLIINVALTLEDFKNLRSLDESESWKEEVNKAIRIKTADALGLPNLDILLGKNPDGIRLRRENVGVSACAQETLVTAAVERGRPFDLLAELPNFILEKVERDITPKLRAEVEASLFPKTITLTLTVLGFLSLIVAILAIVTDKYKLSEVSWPAAVTIGLIGLALIILAVIVSKIVHKLSSRPPDSGIIKQLKKEIEDLKKEVQSKGNHT